jgi:CheY-like chemotaxis protein
MGSPSPASCAPTPLRGVALVALPGYAHDEDRRRAEEAGFARHLRKPATLEELRAPVADAGAGDAAAEEGAGAGA